MTDHDYSNEPQSVSELRAMRSTKSIDWTPRDALIATLRDIDAGKIKARKMLIVYFDETDKLPVAAHINAGLEVYDALGLLEAAKMAIWFDE